MPKSDVLSYTPIGNKPDHDNRCLRADSPRAEMAAARQRGSSGGAQRACGSNQSSPEPRLVAATACKQHLDRPLGTTSASGAASPASPCRSKLASEAVECGATCLEDLPGAAEMGWREYTAPGAERSVFVNDVTYEEAGTLARVVALMRKFEAREAMGIKATGRCLDEISGGAESLVQCSYCARKFNPHSIQRHEEVCKNKFNKSVMRM